MISENLKPITALAIAITAPVIALTTILTRDVAAEHLRYFGRELARGLALPGGNIAANPSATCES